MPIGLVAVEEYCKTVLMSGCVKDLKPLSGILISYVDTGKSETLLQFHKNKGIVVLSDATSFGIVNNLVDGIAKGEIHHIIIPDLLKILERSRRVASELISLLNSLAEEGFTGSLTHNIKIITDRPLYCGFLTSLTADRFHQVRIKWRQIGFSSRIIPMFFSYEREDLEKASKDILYECKVFNRIDLPNIEPTNVSIKDEFREEIGKIADFVAKINNDFTTFRTKRNMVGFIKAHALLKERREVNEEDLKFLKALVPFWFDPIFGNDCDFHIIQRLPVTTKDLVNALDGKYSQATIYRRLKGLESKKVIEKSGETWTTTY